MRAKRLRLPKGIMVSAVISGATLGCSGRAEPDGSTDSASDGVADAGIADFGPVDASSDGSVDVMAFDVNCDAGLPQPGSYWCLPDPRRGTTTDCDPMFACLSGGCAPGCVACAVGSDFSAGVICIPRTGTDAGLYCSPRRVCEAAACPAGCEACAEVLLCEPDFRLDTPPATCERRLSCTENGCGPGCLGVA